MNYTFELNISSFTTPVIGGGWAQATKFIADGGLVKSIDDGYIFARIKFNGNFKLYGSDNTGVKTLTDEQQCDIRVKYKGDVVWQGYLSINVGQDEDSNFGDYKVIESDDVYSELLKNESEDYNIISNIQEYDVRVDTNYTDLRFRWGAFVDGFAGSKWNSAASDPTMYARRERVVLKGDIISGWTTLEDYGDTVRIVKNFGTDYTYMSSISIPYVGGVLNDRYHEYDVLLGEFRQYTIMGHIGTTYTRVLDDIACFTVPRGVNPPYIYIGDCYATYTRFRPLELTIMELVKSIYPDIMFDYSTFEVLRGGNYSDIMISGISDALFTKDGVIVTEKTNKQSIANVTLNKIFDTLRDNFHIYYTIEEVNTYLYTDVNNVDFSSSELTFKIKRSNDILEVNTGANDLTTYKSINVTESDSKPTYKDDKRFSKIKRKTISKGVDFIGQDIEIPSLSNYDVKEIDNLTFYSDIWDTLEKAFNEDDEYPNSTDQFVWLACKGDYHYGNSYSRRAHNNCDSVLTVIGGSVLEWHIDNIIDSNGTIVLGDTNNSWGKCLFGFDLYIDSGSIDDLDFYGYNNKNGFSTKLDISVGHNALNFNMFDNVYGSNNYFAGFLIKLRDSSLDIRIRYDYSSFENNLLFGYRCIYDYGEITGLQSSNAPMSQANIDEEFGAYEMPATPIEVNGSTVNLSASQLLPMKQYKYPCLSPEPTEIDEDMYLKSDKSEYNRLKKLECKFLGGSNITVDV